MNEQNKDVNSSNDSNENNAVSSNEVPVQNTNEPIKSEKVVIETAVHENNSTPIVENVAQNDIKQENIGRNKKAKSTANKLLATLFFLLIVVLILLSGIAYVFLYNSADEEILEETAIEDDIATEDGVEVSNTVLLANYSIEMPENFEVLEIIAEDNAIVLANIEYGYMGTFKIEDFNYEELIIKYESEAQEFETSVNEAGDAILNQFSESEVEGRSWFIVDIEIVEAQISAMQFVTPVNEEVVVYMSVEFDSVVEDNTEVLVELDNLINSIIEIEGQSEDEDLAQNDEDIDEDTDETISHEVENYTITTPQNVNVTFEEDAIVIRDETILVTAQVQVLTENFEDVLAQLTSNAEVALGDVNTSVVKYGDETFNENTWFIVLQEIEEIETTILAMKKTADGQGILMQLAFDNWTSDYTTEFERIDTMVESIIVLENDTTIE